MGTEEEEEEEEEEYILVTIYINLINMVNAFTGHLPAFK